MSLELDDINEIEKNHGKAIDLVTKEAEKKEQLRSQILSKTSFDELILGHSFKPTVLLFSVLVSLLKDLKSAQDISEIKTAIESTEQILKPFENLSSEALAMITSQSSSEIQKIVERTQQIQTSN